MNHKLNLEVRQAEGALLRVLGTAERRGYQPVALEAGPGEITGEFAVLLTVRSERDPGLLARQLANLHDVRHVEVLS